MQSPHRKPKGRESRRSTCPVASSRIVPGPFVLGQTAKSPRIALAVVSHFEEKLDDVALLHDVVLAFTPQQSGGAHRVKRTQARVIIVCNDFGADEAALDVGMDFAGRLRCFRSAGDRPGARLLRS